MKSISSSGNLSRVQSAPAISLVSYPDCQQQGSCEHRRVAPEVCNSVPELLDLSQAHELLVGSNGGCQPLDAAVAASYLQRLHHLKHQDQPNVLITLPSCDQRASDWMALGTVARARKILQIWGLMWYLLQLELLPHSSKVLHGEASVTMYAAQKETIRAAIHSQCDSPV